MRACIYAGSLFKSKASGLLHLAVIASEEEAGLCEALFPTAFVVLKIPVATKSIAAGLSRFSPGTAGEGKTRASAGREVMSRRRPSASSWE